jgi:hypothetical protein
LTSAEPLRASPLRRRSILVAALVGVLAAAVAIPVFALGSSGASSHATAPPGAKP